MQGDRSVWYAAERLALRLLWSALAALFLVVLVPQLWRLFSPFVIALPIAALLQPSIRFCQEKLRVRRGFAVAFWVILVCSVALVVLYWFVSFVVVQVINAANNAPSIISSVVNVLQTATNNILDEAQAMPLSVGETIRSSLNRGFQSLGATGMEVATGLVNSVLAFAASLPYAFVYANFLILGLFFLTGRYERFRGFFQKDKEASSQSVAEDSGGESITMLRQTAVRGMIGYARVQFLFFLLTFGLSWVYFQFLGFEYAIVIGLFAAVLELIPQFGCGTLYIPWAAVSFLIGANENGWLILGLYLGYTGIRRFTEPMLLGSNLGVSPLYSLIGMFVGMQLAGVVGLIAGPIVMVVLNSAIRAHLFDGTLRDCKALYRHMQARWKR